MSSSNVELIDKLKGVRLEILNELKKVIVGQDEFEIKVGESLKLEDYLSASDPIDGDIEIDYNLPEMNEEGNYIIVVSARDSNGNKKDKKVTVTVLPN